MEDGEREANHNCAILSAILLGVGREKPRVKIAAGASVFRELRASCDNDNMAKKIDEV